jgi:hypothetical protein
LRALPRAPSPISLKMASNPENDETTINFDPLLPGSVALSAPIPKSGNEDPFQFQSFSGALKNLNKHPQLLNDMKCAFTSTDLESDGEEEEAKELGVSSGDTYWVCAADGLKGTSCNLEALALEIFQFHCKRLGLIEHVHYDPQNSGAEWWTLFIEGDAEVGMHIYIRCFFFFYI